jgi:hypothetical protein
MFLKYDTINVSLMQNIILSEHNIFLLIVPTKFLPESIKLFWAQKNLWKDRNTLLSFELNGFITDDITVLHNNIRNVATVFWKNKPWNIRFFCGLVRRPQTQNS